MERSWRTALTTIGALAFMEYKAVHPAALEVDHQQERRVKAPKLFGELLAFIHLVGVREPPAEETAEMPF
jgi:hypothetical protein